MNFNSKKISLFTLGITSLVCSRAMFSFFNDPEGPNLLIVVGLAVIVYLISLGIYVYSPLAKQNPLKRVLLLILIQVGIVTALYFCLK